MGDNETFGKLEYLYTGISQRKEVIENDVVATDAQLSDMRKELALTRKELQEDERWRDLVMKDLEETRARAETETNLEYIEFLTHSIKTDQTNLQHLTESMEHTKRHIDRILTFMNELQKLRFDLGQIIKRFEESERKVDEMFMSISPQKKGLN